MSPPSAGWREPAHRLARSAGAGPGGSRHPGAVPIACSRQRRTAERPRGEPSVGRRGSRTDAGSAGEARHGRWRCRRLTSVIRSGRARTTSRTPERRLGRRGPHTPPRERAPVRGSSRSSSLGRARSVPCATTRTPGSRTSDDRDHACGVSPLKYPSRHRTPTARNKRIDRPVCFPAALSNFPFHIVRDTPNTA